MHSLNKMRLAAGLPIDPKLEQINEDHFKKGQKVKDKEGKDWVVIKGSGSGKNETYTVKCPFSGKIREKKVTELVTESDTSDSSPSNFNTSAQFKDGDKVLYKDGVWIVVVADAHADMVGIVPAGLKNASKEEKNKAVQMVKADAIRKPSEEECEVMADTHAELARVNDDMDIDFMEGARLKGPGVWSPRFVQALIDQGLDPEDPEINLFSSSEDMFLNNYMDPEYPHPPQHLYGNMYRLGDTKYFIAVIPKENDKLLKVTPRAEDVTEDVVTETLGLGGWDMSTKKEKQQSLTRKEILAKLSKTKDPEERKKLAAAANRASATQDEIRQAIEKAKSLSESTLNFDPNSNAQSFGNTESDPINIVGQGEKQWANSLDPKTVKSEVPTQLDNRGEQSMTDYEEKIKVPQKLKTALKDAITNFRQEAESLGKGHSTNETAVLYSDTANAFEKILDYLNGGTLQDIKQAQLFASSLMGPMLHKLPDGVWDFLVNGGQKRSLKDYMNKVRSLK